MKVADERDLAAAFVQFLADRRYGAGRLFGIDGDAHQFRTGAGQLKCLFGGRGGIGRVGVGHGLHHHRGGAADGDMADFDADGRVPWPG